MEKKVYLEEAVEGRSNGASGRKTVLLIGDSIRLGYCRTVRDELSDVADVVYPEENCRFSQYILVNLPAWAGLCDPDKVALVQFNCGHWDAAHWGGEEEPLNALPVYQDNVRRIIRRLRLLFPCARVVFATTTPMNPDGSMGKNPRTTEEICRYNEAAVRAAREEGATVDDLFAFARDLAPSCYQDYCHYTPEYFALLGRQVASFLREALREQEAPH